MQDERYRQLVAWLRERLTESGVDGARATVTGVGGDASFRRYFRVAGGDWSFIAVDAPPAVEDSAAFVAVAARLREAGLRAPQVHHADLRAGFMVLEDLGDTLYLSLLRDRQEAHDLRGAERLYHRAIDALLRLQAGVAGTALPPYGRRELRRELELFPEWFCARWLGRPANAAARALLDRAFGAVEDAALAQPRVAVHRDYHSRNLMALEEGGEPGVIDFQDAVHGAYTYDLASLLRDCYLGWDEEFLAGLMDYYWSGAVARGIVAVSRRPEFQRDFDLMGAQRHVKVMGIFARLCLRDGKPGYLRDLPRVMSYFAATARRYRELRELGEWFEGELLPVARQRLAAAGGEGGRQ